MHTKKYVSDCTAIIYAQTWPGGNYPKSRAWRGGAGHFLEKTENPDAPRSFAHPAPAQAKMKNESYKTRNPLRKSHIVNRKSNAAPPRWVHPWLNSSFRWGERPREPLLDRSGGASSPPRRSRAKADRVPISHLPSPVSRLPFNHLRPSTDTPRQTGNDACQDCSAQSPQSNLACSRTVCVAFSCLSGG